MNSTLKKIAKKILIVIFWLVVWQILSVVVGQELLLPSPFKTISRLTEIARTLDFYNIIFRSLIRILAGTIIAVILGILIAVASASVPFIHDLISPLMTVMKSIPVASFIILLILWLDKNVVPAIISTLIVLPIVWVNVETGILQTDKSLLEMAQLYKISLPKKILDIYAPSVLPYFVSSLNSSLGLSWKAGIAAEVIAPPLIAIGKQIYNSKLYLETTDLFAWTLTVILISLVIEKLAVFGIKKAFGDKAYSEVGNDRRN